MPPLCHHRAVNATCHPCATKEVIPAPIFPPTAQLCLQGYAGSGCHPHATPVPCWISSSTHFPPYNPAMLPSALPSFPLPCSAPYHHSTKHTPPSPARGRKTIIKQKSSFISPGHLITFLSQQLGSSFPSVEPGEWNVLASSALKEGFAGLYTKAKTISRCGAGAATEQSSQLLSTRRETAGSSPTSASRSVSLLWGGSGVWGRESQPEVGFCPLGPFQLRGTALSGCELRSCCRSREKEQNPEVGRQPRAGLEEGRDKIRLLHSSGKQLLIGASRLRPRGGGRGGHCSLVLM